MFYNKTQYFFNFFIVNKSILLKDLRDLSRVFIFKRIFSVNIPKQKFKNASFSNYTTIFSDIFTKFTWIKIRVMYYINNWVYTTNHKRIAVNYFWFVILSGIVGMVLATVIRLEFAYPGVGVFAGDSIQYLTLASAHGVIMVFFMIMPLLFGAFANFLLPTQLGVHDVAFPRLNSAAFWFLPGGLLMLAQLVCVDRRYQRMNCFNIREVQSLLKRKFFIDLINTKDHHLFFNKTAIGTRFKTNSINSTNSNIFLTYNYGLEFTPKVRSSIFSFNNSVIKQNNITSFNLNSFFFKNIDYLFHFNFFFYINNIFFSLFYNNWSYSYFNATYQHLLKSIIINFLSFFNLIFFIFNHVIAMFNTLIQTIFLSYYSIRNFWSPIFYFLFESFSSFFTFIRDFIKNTLNPRSIGQFLYAVYSWTINILYSIIDFFKSIDWRNINYLEIAWNSLLIDKYYLYSTQTLAKTIDELKPLIDKAASAIKSYPLQVILSPNCSACYTFNFYLGNISLIFKISFLNLIYLLNLHKELNLTIIFLPNKDRANYFYGQNYSSDPLNFVNTERDISTWSESKIPFFKFSHDGDFFNKYFTFKEYYSDLYFFLYLLLNIPYLLILTGKTIWSGDVLEFYKFLNFFYDFTVIFLNNLFSFFHFYFFFFFNILNKILFLLYKFFNVSWDEPFIFLFKTIFFKFSSFFSFDNFYLITKDVYVNYPSYFLLIKEILTNLFNLVLSETIFFLHGLFTTYSALFFKQSTSTVFIDLYDYLFENYKIFNKNTKTPFNVENSKDTFLSSSFNDLDNYTKNLISEEEISESSKNLRFTNPTFKYDFKSGDYFPKLYKEIYTHLFSTLSDITTGLKTTSWFFSNGTEDIFLANFNNFTENVNKEISGNGTKFHSWNFNKFSHTNGFYNFFYILSNDCSLISEKWISLDTLNYKFSKMFYSSSMQQRIYSNWRQLKFTREAWRCKLLAARHQKTLFKRYVNEDGVFWSIERNAKDLIPGWAMITPFSSRTRFTAIGKTDIGLMGVLLVLNSSIISAANFLVTYRYLSTLNNRKMRDARAFFTEAIMVSSWMMILANPMLVIGIIMLISDRHWQTSFFDYSGGGDTVLFQHMFWFFGHPEVYIIIIPTFGFTNTMLSYYLKKRISARASLLYSMYTIAFLGFFVWGHHMYMVGLAHTTRMLFSTLTVMISVPAATKIMHWCVTTVNSSFAMELPLLFTFTFIFFFVSGGISGMCVAHTGMDVLFHDTFYVIGHFHVMLAGGAMFASFGAFYFYFPAIFGVKYSRIYAYLHYTYYLIGQLMTVIPMFWLGYAGMPRRVLDYPASFGGWHSVISAGHMLNVAGLMAFFFMIFDSLRQARAATRNTFGISIYNTRLNFYLYEIARLFYLRQKASFLYRFVKNSHIKLNKYNYINYEPYETTLISYVFFKK